MRGVLLQDSATKLSAILGANQFGVGRCSLLVWKAGGKPILIGNTDGSALVAVGRRRVGSRPILASCAAGAVSAGDKRSAAQQKTDSEKQLPARRWGHKCLAIAVHTASERNRSYRSSVVTSFRS